MSTSLLANKWQRYLEFWFLINCIFMGMGVGFPSLYVFILNLLTIDLLTSLGDWTWDELQTLARFVYNYYELTLFCYEFEWSIRLRLLFFYYSETFQVNSLNMKYRLTFKFFLLFFNPFRSYNSISNACVCELLSKVTHCWIVQNPRK